MSNYIIEWPTGKKSVLTLTKEQVIKALNVWIVNRSGWVYVLVRNVDTNDVMKVEETYIRCPIREITI